MISVESFLRNHKPVDSYYSAENECEKAEESEANGCDLTTVGASDAYDKSFDNSDNNHEDYCEENSSYSLRKYNLFNGRKPTKKVDAKKASDFDDCRESALRLLDYSARSSDDLKNRLINKGYKENIVESVIIRLEELHLVDDEQYARSVIRSCVSRLLGERATRVELQKKGVSSTVVCSTLQEAREDGVFEEAAWELGRKLSLKLKSLEDNVKRRRFFSAGARKGHDLSTLNEIYYALFKS